MRGSLLLCLVVAGCSNAGTQCFDRVKDDLRDPSSAKILDYDEFPMMDTHITRVTIRASNGRGSYENVYGMCRPAFHKLTLIKTEFMPSDPGWVKG